MLQNFPFRIYNSKTLAIDAFELENGKIFLFFYILDQKFQNKNWPKFSSEWISKLKLPSNKRIHGVSGAHKTTRESIPLFYIGEPGELWARENNLFFKLKSDETLNPGLFLDQSENRFKLMELIRKNQDAKTCLNLFSYTGSFSIYARSLGLNTTSVDFSKSYLNWEKENHIKNFKTSDSVKLLHRDAVKFIQKCKNKYSVIVLDPPSFSRTNGSVMKVKQELPKMTVSCLDLLEKKGILLVSTNLASWSKKNFQEEISSLAPCAHFKVYPGVLPRWASKDYALNSCFILKK